MLYFLSGADSFRIKLFTHRLKEEFLKTAPNAVSAAFDAKVHTLEEAISFLSDTGLFSNPRFAVFAGDAGPGSTRAKIRQELSKISQDPTRVLVSWSRARKASFTKIPHAVSEYFPHLEGRELLSWLQKEGERLGVTFAPAALSWLAGAFGRDSELLFREVEKLATFKPGGTITREDLSQLSHQVPQPQYFPFLEAFLRKEKKEALTLFFQELDRGEDSLRLLGSLTSTFRTLLLLRSAKSGGKLPKALSRANPYWISNLRWQSSALAFSEIRRGFQSLALLDWQIKTGKRGSREGLAQFIISWLEASRGVTLRDGWHFP